VCGRKRGMDAADGSEGVGFLAQGICPCKVTIIIKQQQIIAET
jgi:hypothetical protein